MLIAVALLGIITFLEALPVIEDLHAREAGALTMTVTLDGWLAFAGVGALCLAAGLVPLHFARQRLDSLEA